MTYKGYDESKPKPQRSENNSSDINENTSASSSRPSSTSSSAPQNGGGSQPCCRGDTDVLSVEVGNVLSGNEINVFSGNELLNENTILSDLIGGDVLSDVSVADILDGGILNNVGGVLNDISVSEVLENVELDTDILNEVADVDIKDVLEVDLEDIDAGGIANNVLGGGVLSDIDIKDNVFGAAAGILNVNGDVRTGPGEAEDVKLAVVEITDNVTKLDVLSDVVETGDILKGVVLSDVLEVEDIKPDTGVSLVDDVVVKTKALGSSLDDMNATLEAPVEIATDVLGDGTSIVAGKVEQVTATLEAPVKIVAEVLSGDTIASVLSGNKLVADALNGKFVSTILDGKVIAEVLGGDADLSKIGIEVIDADLSDIVSDTGDVHAVIAAVDSIADLGGLDQLIASVDLFDIGDLLPDLADHHG